MPEHKITGGLVPKVYWFIFPRLNLVYIKTSQISNLSGEGNPELPLLERAVHLHFSPCACQDCSA